MKRVLLLSMTLAALALWADETDGGSPCQYVDPMIGCAWNGHAYPGAVWPFGMVQPGPDTGNGDWQHCSGYVHADSTIYGFSQSHLSGTGCADLGDIRLLPFAGERPESFVGYKDFASERSEAGYYRVALTNLGVMAEVTAGRRVAFHRWTGIKDGPLRALVDFQWGLIVTNGDCPMSITNHIVGFDAALDGDCRGISGFLVHKGWLNRKVYFAIRFDAAWEECEKLPGRIGELGDRYVLTFCSRPGTQVVARVAISEASVVGARKNLESECGFPFDEMRRLNAEEWNRYLGRFDIPGSSKAQKVNFYTALYHLSVQPNLISDVGEEDRYTGFSLWDTFRAAHPLYTLYVPELVPAFVNSMLARYKKQGFLPVIEFGGVESHCMIGNHAVPVVVDAVLKDFPCIDRTLAYEAVTNSLTVGHYEASGKPKRKEDWDIYNRYGYYPCDIIPGESVSRTLECAYDDACAARFARFVGDERGEAFFANRAGNWRNVLDPSSGLVRGKDSKGEWREPFDPFRFGGGGEWMQYDCTEGNAWQYTWSVMQDPMGLIAALGGKEEFVRRLDLVFRQCEILTGAAKPADTTGLIGQYVHGNEPSHHIAFFYPFAGRSDRTAEVVREVCDRFYLPKVDGLCGNDDCGQMSAWYVFAALGFYPLDPCGGEFVLGAPQMPKVTLRVRSATTTPSYNFFTVVAKGFSKGNKYVKSVTFNARPVEGFTICYDAVRNGGTLVFEMGAAP